MKNLTETEALIEQLYSLAHQWTYTGREEPTRCAEEMADVIEGFKLMAIETAQDLSFSWPPNLPEGQDEKAQAPE